MRLRTYLAIIFFLLVLIAYITEKIRERNLQKLEKNVISLGKKFKKLNPGIVSKELKIREYDAKILLRKLASRGKIKIMRKKKEKKKKSESSDEYIL